MIAAVALGASMGDRLGALRLAWAALGLLSNAGPARASLVYATPPVGGVAREGFFNAVVRIDTTLAPLPLLDQLQAIERRIGRRRARRDADRVLDLDLLLHGTTILDHTRLVLPHPRMGGRSFVLQPLADAWPEAFDPRTGVRWATLPYTPHHPAVAVLPARGPRCRPPPSWSP